MNVTDSTSLCSPIWEDRSGGSFVGCQCQCQCQRCMCDFVRCECLKMKMACDCVDECVGDWNDFVHIRL